MRIKTIALMLALNCLTWALLGQTHGFKHPTADDFEADINRCPCDNKDRRDAVVELFRKLGAAEGEVKLVPFKRGKNIVVTLPGSGEGIIVVGAHYDKVGGGCGAIDNWTGVVILARLYGSFRQINRAKTFVFAGFALEEKGLEGSTAMARTIPKKDRKSYCAMVNLDCFGFAVPQILSNVSTPSLEKFTREVAERTHIPIHSGRITTAGADSEPFMDQGIPAISLHGLSERGFRLINDFHDQPDQVRSASLFAGYALAFNLLSALDKVECDSLR